MQNQNKAQRLKIVTYEHSTDRIWVELHLVANKRFAFERAKYFEQVSYPGDKVSIMLEEGAVWLQ
jgi:hypothetical protein